MNEREQYPRENKNIILATEELFDGYSPEAAIPPVVTLYPDGWIRDSADNIYLLRKQRTDEQLFNGTEPTKNTNFYGPGLYFGNTEASLRGASARPWQAKPVTALYRINEAALDVLDLRSRQSAARIGTRAMAGAVRYLGAPPELTTRTFTRALAQHDALIVHPTLTQNIIYPSLLQRVNTEGVSKRIKPAWFVLNPDHIDGLQRVAVRRDTLQG